MHTRFATRNYAGKALKFYQVEKQEIKDGAPTTSVPQISHHTLVVDRSGSMYGSMDAVKATITKVLTLDEYRNSDLLISLISYSGHGDVTVHFERVPVSSIMEDGSTYQQEIKTIRATYLTCISQGLAEALKLVRKGNEAVQCISLHTDGFANDSSPAAEARELQKLVDELKTINGVMVNTIAYNPYSDYKLLSSIANQLNGKCLQVTNIKQFYDALYDTTNLLANKVSAAILSPLAGADYQVFVSRSQDRVNGSAEDMTIRGVTAADDKCIYRYKEIDQATYEASTLPVAGIAANTKEAVFAFARAMLAEGKLNAAKYALVATRQQDMLAKYAKAITNAEIAAMSVNLGTVIQKGQYTDTDPSTPYGLGTQKISVLGLCRILNTYKNDFLINTVDLAHQYKRRGLKKVAGSRDESGVLVEPTLTTAYRDSSSFQTFGGFEINNTSANINMMIIRPINLVDKATGAVIPEVAGIKLDLKDFKQYTVVGDGELNLSRLVIRIASKKLHAALVAAGVAEGPFDPSMDYFIELSELPMVDYNMNFGSLDGIYDKVLGAKVLVGLFGAMLKGQSDTYTEGQIEELKKHYLSTSLYVNFPTTNTYTDLKDALAKGEVDSRLSYKVEIGNANILNAGKLHSANKFLDRMYVVKGGADPKKPAMTDYWLNGVQFTSKELGPKIKVTKIDLLMKEIFDDFFGIAPNGSIVNRMEALGVDQEIQQNVTKAMQGELKGDAAVEAYTAAKKAVEAAADALYEDQISPLVFYVGATGLVPDDFGEVRALTAEQLTAKYPEASLAKAELEGTFFEVGDTILSVYVKNEHFTVG